MPDASGEVFAMDQIQFGTKPSETEFRYDRAAYEALYEQSRKAPEAFWAKVGKRLDWIRPFSKVKDVSFDADDLHIRWYEDGVLNVSANCIDRHLAEHADQTAIIWEGDDPSEDDAISYARLHGEVCRMANVLRARGVQKGDRVIIYMPMIPEAIYAMLACARIGAVHSIVFGGFSPDALASRIEDCGAIAVITADAGVRGRQSRSPESECRYGAGGKSGG